MKTVLTAILLIAFIAVAGYFALPLLIEKQTGDLRSEVRDLKQRLQIAEEFVQREEEAAKIAPLLPDADAGKIIRTVNNVSTRVTTLENSVKQGASSADEKIKVQKETTEDALKTQAELTDRHIKDTEAKIQRSMFNSLMATIRGNVLKAKVELVAKNIGAVKNELELISETFEKAKTSSTDENKKLIDELQVTVKKARTEIDTDLQSATSRIDLLWNEMSKLLRRT